MITQQTLRISISVEQLRERLPDVLDLINRNQIDAAKATLEALIESITPQVMPYDPARDSHE